MLAGWVPVPAPRLPAGAPPVPRACDTAGIAFIVSGPRRAERLSACTASGPAFVTGPVWPMGVAAFSPGRPLAGTSALRPERLWTLGLGSSVDSLSCVGPIVYRFGDAPALVVAGLVGRQSRRCRV